MYGVLNYYLFHISVTNFTNSNELHVILTVSLCMTTRTVIFPCFFLRCKANSRVNPAKTGNGPHSS